MSGRTRALPANRAEPTHIVSLAHDHDREQARSPPRHPARLAAPLSFANRRPPASQAWSPSRPASRSKPDRKSVVSGKRVSITLDPGGRRYLKTKKKQTTD